MSPANTKLCLIDPLTLRGRELLQLLAELPTLTTDLHYLHTDLDEEHQIAELAGNPALVYPLTSLDDLAGSGTIVVCSEADSPKLEQVELYLRQEPETLLVDLSRLERFWDLTRPAVGGLAHRPSPPRLRVAHPALVAAHCLLDRLHRFEPVGLSINAVDPVSAFGRDTIEVVARQAAQRLQGRAVEEQVEGTILAFNLVTQGGDRLSEEAAEVLGTSAVAATQVLAGSFHGHLAQITVVFREPVDDLEVLDTWALDTRIAMVEAPTGLEAIVSSHRVMIAPPSFSSDRRTLAVLAMVDGLLLGGAQTALEIIQGAM